MKLYLTDINKIKNQLKELEIKRSQVAEMLEERRVDLIEYCSNYELREDSKELELLQICSRDIVKLEEKRVRLDYAISGHKKKLEDLENRGGVERIETVNKKLNDIARDLETIALDWNNRVDELQGLSKKIFKYASVNLGVFNNNLSQRTDFKLGGLELSERTKNKIKQCDFILESDARDIISSWSDTVAELEKHLKKIHEYQAEVRDLLSELSSDTVEIVNNYSRLPKTFNREIEFSIIVGLKLIVNNLTI